MTNPKLRIDKQDESRRLFENWMSDGGKFPKAIERSGDGSYKLMQAHSAWTAWSAALDAALAQPAAHGDIEKFKHHSIILNQFCWRISEALGDIGASQDSAYLDISALMDRAVSAISQPQQQARVTDELIELGARSIHRVDGSTDEELQNLDNFMRSRPEIWAQYRIESQAVIEAVAPLLAAPPDPIRALVQRHAAELTTNDYAYFELAYTKQTGWMAWITDKPLAFTVVNPDRKVLATGQGGPPEAACAAALGKDSAPEGARRVDRDSPASELADVEDINRLRALVYVPGAWQCPKCKLRIVRTIMSAATGEMHANEETEPCPNGCGPLWRISERDDRKEAQRSFIDQCDELTKAKARIAELEQAAQPVAQTTHHPDDIAVDLFAAEMKAKLEYSRNKHGRGGWNDKSDCSAEHLSNLLREHVGKGDPVDVANFACFLWNRQERIVPQVAQTGVPERHALVAAGADALDAVACRTAHRRAHAGGEAVSAHISPCGRYRYLLSRPPFETCRHVANARPAVFCMLNPSTADAVTDDPTIRRLRGYARDWGCAGIIVVNLYALRATNPRELRTANDPVGPENDDYLYQAASESRDVICAWGKSARPDRVNRALEIFRSARAKTWCLALSKDGTPKHPLYLRANLKPFNWSPDTATAPSKGEK